MSAIEVKTRLILALDVVKKDRAVEIASSVSGTVDAVKIGWPAVLGCGPEIITELAEKNPIICDFKVADIPNTNRLIAREAFRLGTSAIIAQGFVGSDSVQALVEESGGATYVVTEMSHPGGAEFTQPNAEALAKLARDCKAAGVVAPATRPERLARVREIVGDLQIISPGVGAQGGNLADALHAGADLLIVGRAIYNSDDPRSAALALAEEIERAL